MNSCKVYMLLSFISFISCIVSLMSVVMLLYLQNTVLLHMIEFSLIFFRCSYWLGAKNHV